MATEALKTPPGRPGTTSRRPGRPDQRRHEFARSSRDLLRLVGGLILLLVGLVLATVSGDALPGFETDLTRAVRGMPEGLAVIVSAPIRALAARRLDWWPGRPGVARMLLGRLLLAGVVAAALLALVDRAHGHAPAPSLLAETPPAWATDISTSLGSCRSVAIAVAIYLVARPLLTVPYRRLAVGVITLSAVHVLPGRQRAAAGHPGRDRLRVPGPRSSAWLAPAGRCAPGPGSGRRGPAPDGRRRHRGPPGLRSRLGVLAVLRDHDLAEAAFVKVLGREERSKLSSLFRFYRWLRFRGLGEAIASSLKQSIEHEALVSELAAGDGIRGTPRLLGVTEVDADRLALAFVRINGSSLDGVPAERLTDEVLRGSGAWSPTCIGPGSPTATLRLANLFLDDNGQAWLIDFDSGPWPRCPSSSPVTWPELLCSMAVVVGPRRAVDAAVAELRPEQIQAALPACSRTPSRARPGRP